MRNFFSNFCHINKSAAIFVLCSFAVILTLSLAFTSCEKKKEVGSQSQPQVSSCDVTDKLPTDIKKALDINFENKVKLLGITINKSSQNQMQVSYYWQVLSDFGPFNTVFVHFTDQDKIIFQNDHSFCQGKQFAELKDKFIKETYTVSVPATTAGKEISMRIGLYDVKDPKATRLRIGNAGSTLLDWGDTRVLVEKITF